MYYAFCYLFFFFLLFLEIYFCSCLLAGIERDSIVTQALKWEQVDGRKTAIKIFLNWTIKFFFTIYSYCSRVSRWFTAMLKWKKRLKDNHPKLAEITLKNASLRRRLTQNMEILFEGDCQGREQHLLRTGRNRRASLD